MTDEPELPSSRTSLTPGGSTPVGSTPGDSSAEPRLPGSDAGPNAAEHVAQSSARLPSDPTVPLVEQAAAEPTPIVVETRHTRIARVTAAGGLQALPPGFDEKDGDWESVRSDDPFEVLYLDHEQGPRLTGEIVERHHRLLHELWTGKKLRMHSGAAGRQIALRYGGEDRVDAYPKLVENAYRRLSTPEGREREFRRIDDARREAGERAIMRTVAAYLADGLLDPSETDALLADGSEAGLQRDETAAYIESRLAAGSFHPDGTPPDGTPAQRLLSVSWRTPKRRADDDARRSVHAVAPFKFEGGAASSLAELAGLCDRFPKEAEGYLYRGYFEAWLSGRLGDAPLAAQARAARIGNPDDGSKGVEQVVRAFLKATGTVPAIDIRVTPASISLGELPMGATATQRIVLASEGRERVWGTVRLEPTVPGLAVTSAFENPGGFVELSLDTTTVAAGDYATQVVIEPEGAAVATRVPVRFRVIALSLVPQPASIDLGTLPFGERRTSKLEVASSPHGGRLTGDAVLTTPHPGVRLDGVIAGGASQFSVAVDSRRFRAGERYESVVRLQTNAGTLDVPVTFRVALGTNTVVLWTGGVAVAGGAVLWATRELLANAGDFRGWYADPSLLRGLSATQAGAAALLFAVPAATGWYLRRRWRGRKGPPVAPGGAAGVVGAGATASEATATPVAASSSDATKVKTTEANAALGTRSNRWPLLALALLLLAGWFGLMYRDGQSPVFWTLAAASAAALMGWRRGRTVKRGRKRAATLTLVAGLAATMAYSDDAWSTAPMTQWQPFAEAAWKLGVSPNIARTLGPSEGVLESIREERENDRARAIRAAEGAARAREDDSDAWLLLAAYYLERGDHERAYAAALKAQTERPTNGTALAAVGAVLLARENTELAQRALRSAVQRDPGSEAANFVYGCQLASDPSTVNNASLFLRRAASATNTEPMSASQCAGTRPYEQASWWIAALEHEYTPAMRQASARLAGSPLPPMPDVAAKSRARRQPPTDVDR